MHYKNLSFVPLFVKWNKNEAVKTWIFSPFFALSSPFLDL